jgi:hypothetical protein
LVTSSNKNGRKAATPFYAKRIQKAPVAAPSTVGFERICPQGRGRDDARFSRGWEALRKTRLKPGGAQDQSGMGWPFLWILSFGQAKESIAAAGPRTGVKLSFAVAKQLKQGWIN